MVKIMVLFGVFFTLLTVACGVGWIVRNYHYECKIGQYVKLADDASLPQAKKESLLKYRKALVKYIGREDARYIFKRERFTKTAQLQILDSLISRLDDITKLTPDSFAYQQGMEQVTGQEFDHIIAVINGVFKDCYMREYFVLRYSIPASLFISILFAFIFFVLAGFFADDF